ncbi:MAG: hypothetical protein L6V85_07145 [Clostridiales bacterium]|nr:MAG: hypothetical protein L6V85_07145 [Clostridiales bacterium]
MKCTGALYGRHAFAVSTVTPMGQKILEKTQKFVFDALYAKNEHEQEQEESAA